MLSVSISQNYSLSTQGGGEALVLKLDIILAKKDHIP